MKRVVFLTFIVLISTGLTCPKKIGGLYRYYCGEKNNYKIWIVDGNRVRQCIYKEFLYGGNEQRYLFNPRGEIWIDNAISCEEYDCTVYHELNERHLMAKYGWTYLMAHDSSLAVEQVIRKKNLEKCIEHEKSLKKVSVLDSYGIKEIKSLPDSIKLQNIYRIPEGTRDGISIWVVDGYMVRKNIYPDFGFSGNDMAYHFIPPKEIWIDGQVSCEETEYSIALELRERQLMEKGTSYSDAYESAVSMVKKMRESMKKTADSQPEVFVPDSLDRDSGLQDNDEKDLDLHL
ncbi:MAG TPA: hypothetical protein PKH02_00380 [Bacteroidales bacterium]|nr:hypothetical protein [Bacteroidales bacterium]